MPGFGFGGCFGNRRRPSAVPAVFPVLDSGGNRYSAPLAALAGDGSSFTVPTAALDSAGNSYTVGA